MEKHELNQLAERLNQDPDYRVIKRFVPPQHYCEDQGGSKKIGIFLDVETTGLDPQIDKIIELALVPFEFTSDGKIFRVLNGFDQLEDPGKPLPEKITLITGITDGMLKGQRIDDEEVKSIISSAAVIIAHNARFDRAFVEQRWSEFEKKAWACSLQQVPWSELGYESSKLEYLAYRFGFFFDGHRADVDCLAGIHLLSQELGEATILRTLLDQARKETFRLWAIGSPFDTKDELKARGYRWNGGENGKPKSWYVDLEETDLASEKNFLQEKIFGRTIELPVDVITAFTRFSERI